MSDTPQETRLTGGCRCGLVRYEARVSSPRTVACACPDCQRASGAFLSVAVGVKADRFTITAGQEHLRSYADTGESGQAVHRFFCATCGSPIYGTPESYSTLVSLRVVTLDEPITQRPAFSIFTHNVPPWLQLLGVPDADADA